MVSFSQAKDMFKLQRDAKRIKKELKNIHVEAEASSHAGPGGTVKVVVNAEQEVIAIQIGSDVPRESIEALIKDALNRAMKKAQIVSAERMKGLMGEMGLPFGQ